MSGFVCSGCGRCCRWPGHVRITANEADAIAAFLGLDAPAFIERHTALTRDRRGLTLLERPDGSCAWLTENNRCMLQAVKPRQCAGFPLEWNFPGWENECLGAKTMKQLYGTAVIVSGPSGVGKSTLCNLVRKSLPDLGFSISCTTRGPRGGERDGVEYFFLERQEFERRIAGGEFVEYAEVFSNFYGTLKSQLLDPVMRGDDVFLDIDVQGAMQIRRACESDPVLAAVCEFVFIAPPSFAVLEGRLRGRATDSAEQIEQRIGKAKYELSFADKYDYIVVNDDLETAAGEMLGLIASFKLSTRRRKI